ncbi:MAG TPA: potassium channel family protein [Gemmatimonadales bacterium]|nr:potassium channel family protein [Gemmatimonadales bacterium]
MRFLVGLAGVALLLIVLRDAFETIILPRRVRRRFRLTALYYRSSWRLWRAVATRFSGGLRDSSLGWFGPLSLLVLLALWALAIVIAFGALHWAVGSALSVTGHAPGFLDDLYLSGTTFFTLGLGDGVPRVARAKFLTVMEAGLGFAFLAIIIGYLPVIYQAFSRREVAISMLDARAGSPPAATELLWRQRGDAEHGQLTQLLAEWERWAAEVLESHLSYPVLAYFRSQHGNQSWLAALTTVLDTSALVMAGFDGWSVQQASLTFAMARHAVVDLAQVFSAPEPKGMRDRLPDAAFARLLEQLERAEIRFSEPDARARLAKLRAMYEPYVTALSQHLVLPLPAWTHASAHPDNWQAAPWKPRAPEHF